MQNLLLLFRVFAVTPSILLDNVPSSETTPTNTVKITPKNHTTPDLKNFESLSICTLSDILDIIAKLVNIKTSGIIMFKMIFPTKLIINKIIGSIIELVAILPVYNISVISNGTSKFINPNKSLVVFCTSFIMLEKLAIITVTINMY